MRYFRHVVVFDAADVSTESAFWAALLDGRVIDNDERFHVVIDGDAGTDIEVILDFSPVNIQTLTIDGGDTVSLTPPGTLFVHGGLIQLDGDLQLNPANAPGLTRLIVPADCLVRGAGALRMMGEPGRSLLSIGNTATSAWRASAGCWA